MTTAKDPWAKVNALRAEALALPWYAITARQMILRQIQEEMDTAITTSLIGAFRSGFLQ